MTRLWTAALMAISTVSSANALAREPFGGQLPAGAALSAPFVSAGQEWQKVEGAQALSASKAESLARSLGQTPAVLGQVGSLRVIATPENGKLTGKRQGLGVVWNAHHRHYGLLTGELVAVFTLGITPTPKADLPEGVQAGRCFEGTRSCHYRASVFLPALPQALKAQTGVERVEWIVTQGERTSQ